ncbi:MAG TPA: sigma-54 dependent transcriptional regulator [Myxococcota bacterium]|jgi:DNA-binding NtrC family response regulator|nr:sigma-54 dependent transcriptional regulator [Myxococcota bacterium]
MRSPTALIVDDDANFRESLEALVRREGFETRTAASLADARSALAEASPDVILTDLQLPDGDGLELVRAEGSASGAELVVITGNATVDSAVGALREGVLDYLVKPIDRARLRAALANVARTRALKQEVSSLRSELRELGRFGAMVGASKAMAVVYDAVSRVAPTGATVLVTGESGTGKEVTAETIHRLSPRRDAPLLPLNCGAVSPNLIESELFGHEKGAFTGAERQRKGYFEQAHGGTLFLDEITEMPVELQVKLLRVLETGVVTRVGGTAPLPVDVRVVAATNRDPRAALEEGKLREDLFYRLNVFPIALPPLREREGDIELLAQHFLTELNRAEGTAKSWSRGALAKLRAHPWKGNVRELKNVVQRAFILADTEIQPEALPSTEGTPPPDEAAAADVSTLEVRVGSSIADVERRLILATLDVVAGDKRRASEILGISLKTLYNRLNVYEAGGALRKDDEPTS